MNQLVQAVENFTELEKIKNFSTEENYLLVFSQMLNLSWHICKSVNNGLSKKNILNELKIPREIASRSPFIHRMQNWPRGYQGDFETIEYICESINNSPKNSLEYVIEWYSLNSAIVQQHRNKINIQSQYIINSIAANNLSQILIIGCGSGRDIIKITDFIKNSKSMLYLNDNDPYAIDFVRERLDPAMHLHVTFINNNAISILRMEQYKNKCFDLILFGGVFDYFNDSLVTTMLKRMFKSMLSPMGKIIFTNMKSQNPYKYWMEYIMNWVLIERNQEDCMRICNNAGIHDENVKIYSEETNLALIVEILKYS